MNDSSCHDRIAASFERQGMLRLMGVELRAVEPGTVELWLPYSERITQQQGGFHGGAIGTVADVAAGYAGLTVAPEGMEVVTVEYKINFLGNFNAGALKVVGKVVKPGKRLIITTAEVLHVDQTGRESACALMQQTLMPVPKTY